jgi:hypothetical protein
VGAIAGFAQEKIGLVQAARQPALSLVFLLIYY